MSIRIACECGGFVTAKEGSAGSKVLCTCGRMVPVPSLRELRRQHGYTGELPLPRIPDAEFDPTHDPRLPKWFNKVGAITVFTTLALGVSVALAGFREAAGGIGFLVFVGGHVGFLIEVAVLIRRPELILALLFAPVVSTMLMIRFVLDHWRYTWWLLAAQVLGAFLLLMSVGSTSAPSPAKVDPIPPMWRR
jgi:hypothetical protein